MKKIIASILLAVLVLATVTGAFAESVYTHGSVNLRKKASINAEILKVLDDDTELTVLDTTKDNRGVKWYKVKTGKKTGWVSSVYVNGNEDKDTVKGYLTATGNVNLRSNPNGTILKVIAKGTKVAYFGSKTAGGLKWYLVRMGDTIGWACASYLTENGGKTVKHYVYATDGDSYIRKSPKTTAKIVDLLEKGEKAEYLGESKKDSRGVAWYKVDYDGQTGWVSSAFTTKK